MTNIIYLDNSPVSKPAPQYVQGFRKIIVLIVTSIFIIGNFVLIGTGSILPTVLLTCGINSLIPVALFIWFFRYIPIYPKQICLRTDNMVIIRDKKELNVQYADILRIVFGIYSYDYEGKPCPRFVVVYNSKFIRRQIHLTEDNAKQLAKILDEKEIFYLWDEEVRDRWEEKTGWKQE